jgi:ubiquinone/menaquinone biosynthesis C-methylase UbiE
LSPRPQWPKLVDVSRYVQAGTAAFYDAYGEREWLRLDARPYGRLQAVIHTDFLRQYLRPSERVLDAGCGPGRYTVELAQIGARAVALDTSPLQLRLALEHCQEAGVEDRVEAFVEGDIIDLSAFEDGSFDAVVCFGGPLSYVLDKRQQAADELTRVTRPSGTLLVSAMSRLGAACNLVRRARLEILRDPVPGQVESVLETGDLSGFPSPVPGWDHPAMHLYTSDELVRLFPSCEVTALAGSNVTALEGDPLLGEVAADAAAWKTAVALERRLCRQPGLVDTGSHLILVARRHDEANEG